MPLSRDGIGTGGWAALPTQLSEASVFLRRAETSSKSAFLFQRVTTLLTEHLSYLG